MRTRSAIIVPSVAAAILMCVVQDHGAGQETSSCADPEGIQVFRNQALPLWAGTLTPETEWRACARVIDPWSPEMRVCVTKPYRGHASADFTQARGNKLSDQFCRLSRAFPSTAPKDLASRASLIGPLQVQSSPAIDKLANEFERLKLSLNIPNALVTDRPEYEVELHVQYGSELRLTLSGAPDNDVIVSWIKRALQATRAVNQKAG